MSNIYYNYSGNFIPGTLARAEAVSAEFSSVATGFSKLSIQGIDTGTTNHYVFATTGYPVAAYQDGNNVQFKALNSNTGPSDINVNGIGAVPLLRFNGNPLVAGDVSVGAWYTAIYEVAFGGFTIVSPSAYSTFAGSISGAVPPNKVGLVAAAGVSTAAAPIDVTFAIDQNIAPTWAGLHTFNSHAIVVGAATGGDIGAGKINVSGGFYVNNVLVASGAVVTSIAGTANQIAASASTGAVTLSMPQNVIIPTPASGVALTVNGIANSNTALVQSSTTAGQGFGLQVNGGTNASDYAFKIANAANTIEYFQVNGDASGNISRSGTSIITWAAAGNVTIFAPSSGVALTMTGASATSVLAVTIAGAGTGLNISAPAATFANALALTQSGQSAWVMQFIASTNNIKFVTGSDGTTWTGGGGFQVGAPTGGDKGAGTINVTGLYVSGAPVYSGIPVNSQAGATYTMVLSDANKMVYQSAGGTHTYTIPDNASVAYPNGTAITIYNANGAGAMTLNITSDTLTWSPSNTAGTRTLAGGALATIVKISSVNWVITGVGIT